MKFRDPWLRRENQNHKRISHLPPILYIWYSRMKKTNHSRFRDKGERLSDFSAYSIVACPTCKKPINFILDRVTCPHCGFNKTFKVSGTWFKYLLPTIQMEDYL